MADIVNKVHCRGKSVNKVYCKGKSEYPLETCSLSGQFQQLFDSDWPANDSVFKKKRQEAREASEERADALSAFSSPRPFTFFTLAFPFVLRLSD